MLMLSKSELICYRVSLDYCITMAQINDKLPFNVVEYLIESESIAFVHACRHADRSKHLAGSCLSCVRVIELSALSESSVL